jgi:hypothetical protein
MDAVHKVIPKSVEEMDEAWFNSIFGGKLRGLRRLRVVHGTATKVHFELDMETAEGIKPQRVWVKTGLEPHSKQHGHDVVYAGETFFYRNLGGKYETRTPACFYAESDQDGHSAIVLDDLGTQGATFMEPAEAGSPDLVARGLEAIARYQAASWMRPELYAIDWLRNGGSFTQGNAIGWVWNEEHFKDYSTRPRFKYCAKELQDRDRLLKAHTIIQNERLRDEPWALSHGDAHFGQAYVMPDGEVRLIDWQCVQIANYAQDLAYFMVGGLTVEDRRKHAKDLVAHYVGKLGEFGVARPPTVEEAWAKFPPYLVHGMGWVMCFVELQPEENCAAMTERFSAAMIDFKALEALGV